MGGSEKDHRPRSPAEPLRTGSRCGIAEGGDRLGFETCRGAGKDSFRDGRTLASRTGSNW